MQLEVERRASRRYQVRLHIHYHVSEKGSASRSATATTCDMSTGGLSFRSRKSLPVGSHVEMLVEWPAKHRDDPVELQMTGFIVRSGAGRTAVRITFWRFRVDSAAESIRATA